MLDAEDFIVALGWAIFIWLLWLILDASPAQAQEYETASVAWEAPTERENGDPLPPEELLFYELHVNQLPAYEGENDVYNVSSDRTQHDIQLVADQCFTITMYAAATGSPACRPEQQYLLSQPSNAVEHCTGSASNTSPPKPPTEFM